MIIQYIFTQLATIAIGNKIAESCLGYFLSPEKLDLVELAITIGRHNRRIKKGGNIVAKYGTQGLFNTPFYNGKRKSMTTFSMYRICN